MFNDTDKARAAAILANYGATHFQLMPNGHLLAIAGTQAFAVIGEHLNFGLNDEEAAAVATKKALADAQAAPQGRHARK